MKFYTMEMDIFQDSHTVRDPRTYDQERKERCTGEGTRQGSGAGGARRAAQLEVKLS